MTAVFEKAFLQELDPAPASPPTRKGPKIPVQLNPGSLKFQLANSVDVGKSTGRQATQAQGSSSATLSFDLVFDTADVGTTSAPVDVRTLTRPLEQFVLPKKGAKQAPPPVVFQYGTLEVFGVMSALNQEFDLFSTSGVPLRAKVSVTIKELKPEFSTMVAGSGANSGSAATDTGSGGGAGARGAGPGAGRGGAGAPPDRTGTALAGESAAGFAARMGLDASAWKGLSLDIGIDPLRLEAGARIDFSSDLSASVGLGSAGDPRRASSPDDPAALTARGGLTRALAEEQDDRNRGAAAVERAAFAGPSAAGPAPSPPLAGAAPAAQGRRPASAATRRPEAQPDPRATGYGFGVPLRDRVGLTRATRHALVGRRAAVGARRPADQPPESDDPTTPGWKALPPPSLAERRAAAGRHCRCSGGAMAGCSCGSGAAR